MCPSEDDFSDLLPDTSAASPKKNVPSRQEIAEAASYRSEGRRKPKGRRVEATVSRSPMKVVSLGKIKAAVSKSVPLEIDPMKEIAGRRAEMAIMALAIFSYMRTHLDEPSDLTFGKAIEPFIGQHFDKGKRIAKMLTASAHNLWEKPPEDIARYLFDHTESFFRGIPLPLPGFGFLSGDNGTREGVVNFADYVDSIAAPAVAIYCEVTASCYYGDIIKSPHPFDLVIEGESSHHLIEIKNRGAIDFNRPADVIEAIVLQRFADQMSRIIGGDLRVFLTTPDSGHGIAEFLPLKSPDRSPVTIRFDEDTELTGFLKLRFHKQNIRQI